MGSCHYGQLSVCIKLQNSIVSGGVLDIKCHIDVVVVVIFRRETKVHGARSRLSAVQNTFRRLRFLPLFWTAQISSPLSPLSLSSLSISDLGQPRCAIGHHMAIPDLHPSFSVIVDSV